MLTLLPLPPFSCPPGVDCLFGAQINADNPLGMDGKLALQYGELIQDMWSNSYRVCAPTKFKSVIGKFAPQFSGYQQQDSQVCLTEKLCVCVCVCACVTTTL